MKIAVFVLCLFCAASVAAQTASVASAQPQMLRMTENPQHASQHDMATEESLLHCSAYHYEHGERPLWEFGPVSQPVPLGDIARAYRAGHVLAKKAEVVLEKQN
jgi:hypothetical protein